MIDDEEELEKIIEDVEDTLPEKEIKSMSDLITKGIVTGMCVVMECDDYDDYKEKMKNELDENIEVGE